MNATEQKVTANPDIGGSGCYVIERERSYSTLGFDVTLDRIERYALNLFMDEKAVDALMRRMRPKRGEIEVYEKMRELEVALIDRYRETGERAVAELSPQLEGLEGNRVEVVRLNGERKRFIVGKSTGPIPCHLEISRRNAMGGGPADKEYRSVTVVERVR